ncbi:MAG: glycerophosphodiester phosphodiesterase [Halobacteriovoraceae bacterium]|nr:glycerophosphodiester phosphodiesterase [Halobacteriovoraceae bacterium]
MQSLKSFLGVSLYQHIIRSLEFTIDLFYSIVPYAFINKSLSHKKPKIVAHRGWHEKKIKENTLESFQMAFEKGLYGIEFDVRWTKDLVPVIHHDVSLQRVWDENIQLEDITYDELRKRFPQIPSLEDVIEKFGKKLHLFIELKQVKWRDIDRQKFILKNLLSSLVPVEDFHIMALSMDPIQHFNCFPAQTYLLVSSFDVKKRSLDTLEHKIGGVTGHFLLIHKAYLGKHFAQSQKIGTGFIWSKNCLYREMARGVEWHFTNHPWRLIK